MPLLMSYCYVRGFHPLWFGTWPDPVGAIIIQYNLYVRPQHHTVHLLIYIVSWEREGQKTSE